MLVFENNNVVRKPFGPQFRSRNQLTVAYDPEASCPRFENELLTPALSPDDKSIARKMCGLMVSGRNRPQRIFILIGGGNTGKTTLGKIIEGLVGQENVVQLRTGQLDTRFELARLVNKTLAFGPDVHTDFLSSRSAHTLKSLVGGDPLTAERKNSNETFSFKGDLNVLITCNEDLLVRLRGAFDRSAWFRRLCLLLFVREPVALPDPDFPHELLAKEGSGILNYAIGGLLDYYKDEAECGNLALSPEQVARIDNLLTQSEGFATFLNNEVVEEDGQDISVDELLDRYGKYAKEQKWRTPKRRTLREQAQDLVWQVWGISESHSVQRDGKNVRGYRGIRLKEGEEHERDPF
jgi:P4 family phage/plasmid primase-like protien